MDQGHFKVTNKALMAVAAADMTFDIVRGPVIVLKADNKYHIALSKSIRKWLGLRK